MGNVLNGLISSFRRRREVNLQHSLLGATGRDGHRLGRIARRQLDNAIAENFHSLYKWELIYPQVPRRGLDDVELPLSATSTGSTIAALRGEFTDDITYVAPTTVRGRLLPSDSGRRRDVHPMAGTVMKPRGDSLRVTSFRACGASAM